MFRISTTSLATCTKILPTIGGMDPASAAMAGLQVFATVDSCIKYGKELVKKCKAYRQADQQIRELTLIVEDHWLKIEDQMSCLKKIWATLECHLQVHYHTLFSVLSAKLQQSIDLIAHIAGSADGEASLIELLQNKGKLRKTKFALSGKECIEKAVKELDEWHRMFDPSWYMMRLITDNFIDFQLATFQAPVSNPVSVLKSMRDDNHNGVHSAGLNVFIKDSFVTARRKLPCSPVHIAQEAATDFIVITDRMVCRPDMDTPAAIKDVRNLARELTKTAPLSFNLLGCRGVIKHERPLPAKEDDDEGTPILSFEFVFAVPRFLSRPRSLRELLLSRDNHPFLDEKVELAKQLANSVAFIHAANFVHKNIRPETVLVFEQDGASIGAAFLAGFETFRRADGRSYGHRGNSWEKNNTIIDSSKACPSSTTRCSMTYTAWESACWKSGFGNHSCALVIEEEPKRAYSVKELLTAAARERLPIMVGPRYSNVVVSCLTCLDRDDQGLGDESEFQDEDGVVIGVKYIEQVLLELQQIAV